MATKDFRAVVMVDGKETKQRLRFGNFPDGGGVEEAKKLFNDLHANAKSGQSIKSIEEIGPTPVENTQTIEGLTTPPA